MPPSSYDFDKKYIKTTSNKIIEIKSYASLHCCVVVNPCKLLYIGNNILTYIS